MSWLEAFLGFIFFVSLALVIYHHAVYPAALRLLARRFGDKPPAPPVEARPKRSLTIVIPAYNEQDVIGRKLQNTAGLEYPRELLRVLVMLDGCSDDTEAICRSWMENDASGVAVELVVNADNQGKIATLNQARELTSSDIVVLSDASALVGTKALVLAESHFDREAVGFVCGSYRPNAASDAGERLYWRYQTRIKEAEGELFAPIGAHGAFYAFRRSLWVRMPADTVNDDFVIPMEIVGRGYRGVYDTSIEINELVRDDQAKDWRRRVRLGAGNAQQLARYAHLLSPVHGWTAFLLASGKGLRVLTPFLILAGLIAAAVLAALGSGLFQTLVLGGLCIVALFAALEAMLGDSLPRPVASVLYLLRGHMASGVGVVQYLRGDEESGWAATHEAPASDAEYLPTSVVVGKRVMDIIVGIILFGVLMVIFLPVALAIKLDSRGPIFYRQKRVGVLRDNRSETFEIIKFRTMSADAESKSGAVWAQKKDPRVTRVGRFLRKTRIDEIPQCINVLKGEMSLIGPRPERPKFVKELQEKIPYYTERTTGLRPGITGLAQVTLDYDSDIEDVKRKLEYDHAYAMRISTFWGWIPADLSILLRTFGIVVMRRGH